MSPVKKKNKTGLEDVAQRHDVIYFVYVWEDVIM